jgi:5'(3')-deoxyribonucleotidase
MRRFFVNVDYMDNAKEVLDRLKDNFQIIIVSCGYIPNLKGKEIWCKEHLPYTDFVGVNFEEYSDKSHIDMSDGIFIDDSMNNLVTSNAKHKICFGDIYDWNKNWDGKRCFNWYELEAHIGDFV